MAEDFLIGVGKDNREYRNNRTDQSQQPTRPSRNNNGNDNKSKGNKQALKGCGIGCLALIVIFFGLTFWFGSELEDYESKDLRTTYLKQDMDRLTRNLTEKDSLSQFVKLCLDIGISEENELDKDDFKYFTRRNGNKLLIIVEITDMQDIEASTRKGVVEIIEECFSYAGEDENPIDEYYICIEGKWNTLLVKTPYKSDLGGRFADEKLLLPFYDEYVKDSLPNLE